MLSSCSSWLYEIKSSTSSYATSLLPPAHPASPAKKRSRCVRVLKMCHISRPFQGRYRVGVQLRRLCSMERRQYCNHLLATSPASHRIPLPPIQPSVRTSCGSLPWSASSGQEGLTSFHPGPPL